MASPLVRLGAVLVAAGSLAAACGDGGGTAGAVAKSDLARVDPDPGATAAVADSSLAFGLDLYRELAGRDDDNLVISPHSIAVALAMTRAGADGDTAAAIDATMHTTGVDLHPGFNTLDRALTGRAGERERSDGSKAELELNIANALWGQEDLTFEEPFLDTLAQHYGAGMRLVDYRTDAEGARVEINRWVAGETADRITDLIPEAALNELTRLVLTNAVYLLAPWELPFDEEATSPGTFVRLDGADVEVEMMRLSEQIRYARVGEVQAIELPYVGRELAMLVLVPDTGSFGATDATLSPELIAETIDALAVSQVELRFPRFEFRTQASLAPVLTSLGMAMAFDPGVADFSRMTTEEQLFIADVIHEAIISVDEEGTEAAAATAVAMAATSAPPEPIRLDVDRPFVFLLRDTETGALLFVGRVTDPTG